MPNSSRIWAKTSFTEHNGQSSLFGGAQSKVLLISDNLGQRKQKPKVMIELVFWLKHSLYGYVKIPALQ